jgi:hypothetical protein
LIGKVAAARNMEEWAREDIGMESDKSERIGSGR